MSWFSKRTLRKLMKEERELRVQTIAKEQVRYLENLAKLLNGGLKYNYYLMQELAFYTGRAVSLQFSIPNLNIQGSFMSQTINKTTFDAAGGKLPYHLTGRKSTNPNVPIDSVQSVTSSDTNIATVEQDPSDPTKLHVGWVGEGNVTIEAVAVIQGKTEKAQLDLTLVEEPQLTIDEG